MTNPLDDLLDSKSLESIVLTRKQALEFKARAGAEAVAEHVASRASENAGGLLPLPVPIASKGSWWTNGTPEDFFNGDQMRAYRAADRQPVADAARLPDDGIDHQATAEVHAILAQYPPESWAVRNRAFEEAAEAVLSGIGYNWQEIAAGLRAMKSDRAPAVMAVDLPRDGGTAKAGNPESCAAFEVWANTQAERGYHLEWNWSKGRYSTDRTHHAFEVFRQIDTSAPKGADYLTDARAAEIMVQMREHMLAWGGEQGEDHVVLDIEQDAEEGFPAFAGECFRFLAPLLARPAAMGAGSLPGWKLVPIDPTDEMLDAVAGTSWRNLNPSKQAAEVAAYSKMLSVAPRPPASGAGDLFAVFKTAVYRHECGGIFTTQAQAEEVARSQIESEPDDHHEFEVVPFVMGVPTGKLTGRGITGTLDESFPVAIFKRDGVAVSVDRPTANGAAGQKDGAA